MKMKTYSLLIATNNEKQTHFSVTRMRQHMPSSSLTMTGTCLHTSFVPSDHDGAMIVHRPRDKLSARGLEGACLMLKTADNGTSACDLQIYDQMRPAYFGHRQHIAVLHCTCILFVFLFLCSLMHIVSQLPCDHKSVPVKLQFYFC